MMTNIYNQNGPLQDNQSFYNSYNEFIFSSDRDVFNKLLFKYYAYGRIQELHGDIVECGVFKGSGIAAWLKILALHEPNSIRKVIGLDAFDPTFVNDLNDYERAKMTEVFARDKKLSKADVSYDAVSNRLKSAGFGAKNFELIRGDISKTALELSQRPGLRISILYMDVDIYKPTYDTLQYLWNAVVPGGMVVFDEYCYHAWTETNAVDDFLRDYNILRPIQRTLVRAPTAYIIK